TSATPTSSPCSSWPTSCSRSPARRRRSCASRCRSTTRRSAGPTSRWPAACSAGSRRCRCARASSARPRGSGVPSVVPAPAGRDDWFRLLSVIVPVFNERNTLPEILRRIRRVELPIEVEVLLVDDGSSDGSNQIATALEDSTVRVISHPANKGKGAAVRTGLAHARGDLILIQDADLEYDPEDWPRLLKPMLRRRAPVVYGSRFTGERKNMMFLHWVGNRFLSM